MRVVLLVAAASCACLLLAGGALAARPFKLAGSGERPNVAVDAAGVGHFVWEAADAAGDLQTHYCRVARRARRCTGKQVLPIPRQAGRTFSSLTGAFVFAPGGGRVVVATYRNGLFARPDGNGDRALFVFTSTDGGRTFGPPALVGTQAPSGDAILGPGDSVSVASNAETGGLFFQSAPVGGFTSTIANVGDAVSQWYDGSIALLTGAVPLIALDDLESIFYRRYSGSGDLNDPASWTPTTRLGAGTDPRLAGGPAGVYLMYRQGPATKKRYVVRRYARGGFGRATALSETGDPIFSDFSQDTGGRLHAVWLSGGRSLVNRASDATTFWGPARTIVDSSVAMFDIEIAAGADGTGFAVWRGGGIRAVALASACSNRIAGTRRPDTLRGTGRGDHLLG
ncbi:MAG: hypothetical protein ACE5EV_03775, partial [Gaiellales bacterium]